MLKHSLAAQDYQTARVAELATELADARSLLAEIEADVKTEQQELQSAYEQTRSDFQAAKAALDARQQADAHARRHLLENVRVARRAYHDADFARTAQTTP